MSRKSCKYAMANTLWQSHTYVDQHRRIFAMVNNENRVIFALRESAEWYFEAVSAAQEGNETPFRIPDLFEIGTTNKNLDACFKLYLILRKTDVGNEHVDDDTRGRRGGIRLFEYFTHTRAGARRHGGFRAIREATEMEKAAKIIAEAEELFGRHDFARTPLKEGGFLYEDEPDDGVWWDGYDSEEQFWECNGI